MPKPTVGRYYLSKYADDTVLIELLSRDDVCNMNQTANDRAGWCHDNDLVLNTNNKTKEIFLCNVRDNPIHDALTINGNCAEQVLFLKNN